MSTENRTRGRRTMAVLAALGALGGPAALAGPASANPASAVSGWTLEPAPLSNAALAAVAAIDGHRTWAVGYRRTSQGKDTALNPLVLARDDRTGTWRTVPTPADRLPGRLNALAADGPRDVWLVGDDSPTPDGVPGTGIVTEHWNGRTWQTSTAPIPPGTIGGGLLGVATLGPRDAWAVGYAQVVDESGVSRFPTLIEHWDGDRWTAAAVKAPQPDIVLNAVAAAGPSSLWAAGFDESTFEPVLMHDDGTGWTRQRTPDASSPGMVNALSVNGPDDVWAVGYSTDPSDGVAHPLVDHYDGHAWRRVTAPPGTGQLQGAARTAEGIAVVGYDRSTTKPYGEELARGAWRSLDIPDGGTPDAAPNAIVETPRGLLTVGGYSAPDGTPEPLLLFKTGG